MKIIYYTHNKKEFKFLLKYFNIKRKMKGQYPSYISINEDYDLSFSYVPEDFDVLIDVSKLIEEKKSKLEKRISKIESKVEGLINQNLTKSELNELPEKWCVKANEDNSELILKWFEEKLNRDIYGPKGYAHYPEFERQVCTSDEIKEGYTEISFSDFERLVLKKEESKDIEVGKWYKEKSSKFLFFISKIDENKALGYGFSSIGYWFNDYSLLSRIESDCHLATNQEVEEVLKNEAVKRGFKKGINIKTPNGTEGSCKNGVLRYDKILNYLFIDEYACFVEGKWAEIVQENNTEIDWSIPGQIVKGEYTTAITTGKHNNSLFEGFVIKVTDESNVNHLCKTLIKEYFSLAKGEIILKN